MKNIKYLLILISVIACSISVNAQNSLPEIGAHISYSKAASDGSFYYGESKFKDSTILDLKLTIGPLPDSIIVDSIIVHLKDPFLNDVVSDTISVTSPDSRKKLGFYILKFESIIQRADSGYITLLDTNGNSIKTITLTSLL